MNDLPCNTTDIFKFVFANLYRLGKTFFVLFSNVTLFRAVFLGHTFFVLFLSKTTNLCLSLSISKSSPRAVFLWHTFSSVFLGHIFSCCFLRSHFFRAVMFKITNLCLSYLSLFLSLKVPHLLHLMQI